MNLQDRISIVERRLTGLSKRHKDIIEIVKSHVDGVLTYYICKLGSFDFSLADNLARNIRNSYRRTGANFEAFQVPVNFNYQGQTIFKRAA